MDDDVSAETREMSEWYTHMSAVVSSFSGMSIAPPDYEIPASLSGSLYANPFWWCFDMCLP